MRTYAMLVVVQLLFHFPYSLNAQTDSTKRSDIARFADGVFHNLSSPVRWKQRDWMQAGAVVLATAAASSVDLPINNFWQGKHDPTLDAINDVGYHYGKAYSAMIATGGFYITGILINDRWAKETGLMLGTSLMTSAIMMSTLKPFIGRSRPEVGKGNYDFHPFSREARFHSLPSGHVAMALSISFTLAKRIRSIPLKVFFYSLAGTTIFCRLYSGAHWLSDEVLSGAIAWFSASESISHLTTTRYKRHSKTVITFRPIVGGASLKIAFN